MLRKAINTSTTTLSTAGRFGPEQFANFFELVQEEPTLMQDLTIQPMGASVSKLESLEFGGPITVSAEEGVGTDAADYGILTASKKELEAKKIRAVVPLSYEFIEDLLTKNQSPEDYVAAKMAKRFALDLERLAWLGDTASEDKLLMRLNGFRKQMTANGIDYSEDPQPVNEDRFLEMYLALPKRYRMDKRNLRFYCDDDIVAAWKHKISKRETGAGDTLLLNGIERPTWNGIPLYSFAAANAGEMALTSRLNLKPGVYRDIRTFRYDYPLDEIVYFGMTMRLDFKIFEVDGCVLMEGLDVNGNIVTV
jgi:HK97 family phage major capsid protein